MNLEKDLLHIGTIVNTFGTKGFVKVLLRKEIDVAEENPIINLLFVKNTANALQPLRVETVEFKNETLLLKFVDLNEINQVMKLKGQLIYALSSDHVFEETPLLDTYEVVYNEEHGHIIETLNNGVQDIIKVAFGNQKPFWVPLVDVYLETIDNEQRTIFLKNLEGLK